MGGSGDGPLDSFRVGRLRLRNWVCGHAEFGDWDAESPKRPEMGSAGRGMVRCNGSRRLSVTADAALKCDRSLTEIASLLRATALGDYWWNVSCVSWNKMAARIFGRDSRWIAALNWVHLLRFTWRWAEAIARLDCRQFSLYLVRRDGRQVLALSLFNDIGCSLSTNSFETEMRWFSMAAALLLCGNSNYSSNSQIRWETDAMKWNLNMSLVDGRALHLSLPKFNQTLDIIV